MTPPSLAQQERQTLCDLFVAEGAEAPTLCAGWSTADLAAHLVVRERRPDSGPGLVWPPLAAYTDKVRRAVRDRTPWETLIETVRRGPPLLLRPFDGPMNTVEFFIHVEDVRRARDGWEPRSDLFGPLRCPLGPRGAWRNGEEGSRHHCDHVARTGRQGGGHRATAHPGRRSGRAHRVLVPGAKGQPGSRSAVTPRSSPSCARRPSVSEARRSMGRGGSPKRPRRAGAGWADCPRRTVSRVSDPAPSTA